MALIKQRKINDPSLKLGTDPTPDMLVTVTDKTTGKTKTTELQNAVKYSGISLSSGVIGEADPTTIPDDTTNKFLKYSIPVNGASIGVYQNFPTSDVPPYTPIEITQEDLNTGIVELWGKNGIWRKNIIPIPVAGLLPRDGYTGSANDLFKTKLERDEVSYKRTSAQEFDKTAVLRDKGFLDDGILIDRTGNITSSPMSIPEDINYIGVAGLSPTTATIHRYRFLDGQGLLIGPVSYIPGSRYSQLITKFPGAAYFDFVLKNPGESDESQLETISVTFGSSLTDNQFNPDDYIDGFRVMDSVDLGSGPGYKTTPPIPIPDGMKSVFLDGLKLYNHTARCLDSTGRYISGSYQSIYANSAGGLYGLSADAKFYQITYKNASESDDDIDNTFILKFSDCDPTAISAEKTVEGIGKGKIFNYDSDLYSDYIVGTTQEPTIADGQLSKMEHKKGGVTVRTDIFTYSSNTITETRVSGSGRVVFVTDLTTLITQISN